MAYVTIPVADVDAGSTIDETLMKDKIKNNLDDLNSRVITLETAPPPAGGGQIENVYRGEKIPAKKAVILKQKRYLDVTDSNKYIDLNEGASDLPATVATGRYFLDNDDNIKEFTDAVKSALDTAGGQTYTVTFNKSTLNFTISAGSNFSLKWKTGAHGSDNADDHIGTLMGFDDSADDTSAMSFTSDNDINDQFSVDIFAFMTDADFLTKSIGYFGIDEAGGNKFSTGTIKFDQEISTVVSSAIPSGVEVFTQRARIDIDATNNKIDFQEAGGPLVATLATATYFFPYTDLVADIKAKMESAGSGTYNISFSRDEDKFTFAKSSNFTLLWNTGSNKANSVATTIGFSDAADDGPGQSFTSDNTLNLRGTLDRKTASTADPKFSAFAGFARKSGDLFVRKQSGQRYLEVVNEPTEFLAAPIEKDYTEEIQVIDQHENSLGQGVRAIVTTGSPATYKFQYKNGPNGGWVDSSTTFTYGTPGASTFTNNFNDYREKSRIFMDEDGTAVFGFIRFNTSTSLREVWVAHSTDGGDNWSLQNGAAALASSGSFHFYVAGIYIREKKAVILTSLSANDTTILYISDDSGSGYTSWSTVNTSSDFRGDSPAAVFIQFFPEQSGINKYRIVMMGRVNANNRVTAVYFLGDGTSPASVEIFGAITRLLYTATIDQLGDKNKILAFGYESNAADTINTGISNGDYNGGTLTFNNHSQQNINSGGGNINQHNGSTSDQAQQLIWNSVSRAVLAGPEAFLVIQDNSNTASAIAAIVYYTNDVDAGSYTNLAAGFSTGNHQESAMKYVSAAHAVVFSFKYNTDTLANNYSNGQIWARVILFQMTGAPIMTPLQQIDGGEAMSGKQAFNLMSSNAQSASISWEKFDSGDTRDKLQAQFAV